MKALGIILAGGKNEGLRELTEERALAAMPVAGSYRVIDFVLSNMTNSGVEKAAVITQYNSRSLMEYLSSSKWWDFGRKHGGLFIFAPYKTRTSNLWYQGTADAIYQNIAYLKEGHEPYVVMAQGDSVIKIDFENVLEFHIQKKADITLVCKKMPKGEKLNRCNLVTFDKNQRIIDFEEKPLEAEGDIVSVGIYIIRRRLLIEMLEEIEKEERYDFTQDILVRYRKNKKLYAYMHEGYWRNMGHIDDYYQGNMDFLKLEMRNDFFREEPSIMSKVADEPPAKFNLGSKVSNSLCSNGCIINGQVNNSVLFRKVYIGKETTISDAVVLEGAHIGDYCQIQYAIIEETCIIPDGSVIKGTTEHIKRIRRTDRRK